MSKTTKKLEIKLIYEENGDYPIFGGSISHPKNIGLHHANWTILVNDKNPATVNMPNRYYPIVMKVVDLLTDIAREREKRDRERDISDHKRFENCADADYPW